ncbi:MAG: phosphoribosylamine--glycine ligase [Alphaproteobacteria bacterium]
MPTNVLLIGGGGREHALAWKLAQSPMLGRLYATPGNPGIAAHASLVALDIDDHVAVRDFCAAHVITLVVVGPEAPLVAGIADDLTQAGILVFGPSRQAARLEGSKGFTKTVCAEAGIPTAAFAQFNDAARARAYVAGRPLPIVIKADGLAAGKGVTIATTQAEAEQAIAACFAGSMAADGVVIEDFLEGEEASFFVLTDGQNIVPLATAQDHKRVGDGDTGPNTGGMGAYSPAPIMTPELIETTLATIIRPTVTAMAARGTPYCGVLYAGLMITANGPELIEYNARFGDPEAQVLMLRLASDLLDMMLATAEGRLADITPTWRADPALTVVMAAKGYPGAYSKGTVLRGIAEAERLNGVTVFQAGTAQRDGEIVAAGGRVLNVTATAPTITEARDRAYRAVDTIDWPEGFCRRDIGWRAITREG